MKAACVNLLLMLLLLSACDGSNGNADVRVRKNEEGKMSNRLINEKSPYLLQHVHNPVDWYPWGEEAFAKARREDKPVFLSIGYSTCHWCHVMERESFEDAEVATLLNEHFVSIKVDREERPDIDGVYMTVCQMLTGSGGWPLTVIMTPDRKPFYAGTYFPKQGMYGRPGMMDMLPQLAEAWKSRREELLKSADEITSVLGRSSVMTPGDAPGATEVKAAFGLLERSFDDRHGGFGQAPKFPTPHQLLLCLRHWKRSGDARALEMVEKTLQAMRRGGICDHLGFGFHRYSTDERWFAPHFEKMLYDQAMIALALIETHQATGKIEYRRVAEEIFTYVIRDMTSPTGAFYSAEDADSEGVEGKFYLWTTDEIRKLLPEAEAKLVIDLFNLKEGGTFEEGGPKANILHLTGSMAQNAARLGLEEDELRRRLEPSLTTLFKTREKRIHPYKDDKVLADWNGLMIAALARAARVFDEPGCLAAAEEAIRFNREKMRTKKGRLFHRYRDGSAGIDGGIDDYAFMIWGLIEMYESSFDAAYLEEALQLNLQMLYQFWDEKAGGLFSTADDAEQLIVRQKEGYDGAVPSGNSVAMMNLIRLARITADPKLEQKAAAIGKLFSGPLTQSPTGFTQMLCAVDFAAGPSYEVVIAGERGADDTKLMLRAVESLYIPNKVVLLRPAENDPILTLAPYLEANTSRDGKATAYVCRNYACQAPVTDPEAVVELLAE
jgi:uncharacterized protein YyaL (SSP411 family)